VTGLQTGAVIGLLQGNVCPASGLTLPDALAPGGFVDQVLLHDGPAPPLSPQADLLHRRISTDVETVRKFLLGPANYRPKETPAATGSDDWEPWLGWPKRTREQVYAEALDREWSSYAGSYLLDAVLRVGLASLEGDGLLRLGAHAERLLWAIHRAVLRARCSVLRLPERVLAQAVWGMQRTAWPRHRRQDLLAVLKGLSWLHLADWAEETPPPLGQDTALLTQVADLRDSPELDRCDEDCPDRDGPSHHHLQINVGCGFLGVLEQFARHDPQTGARVYDFRVRGRKGVATLRSVGKQGRLVSVYLPAKLGEPGACAALTPAQHRLLQALVRETTRQAKRRRRELAETEVFAGNIVRGFHRKGSVACPLLDPNGRWVGFNGNRVRKGQGYRQSTPRGWQTKAGYAPDDVPAFLDDLAVLSRHLGLTAVALDRSGGWSDLDQVRALTLTAPGRRTLRRLHLRVYACADYLQRWDAFFCWQPPAPAAAPSSGDDTVTALAATMAAKSISRRRLAGGIGQDHSFLGKLFNGKKRWPQGLLERACAWVADQPGPEPVTATTTKWVDDGGQAGLTSMSIALGYRDRGWVVVPQLPGAKQPCLKWKEFQERVPTVEEMTRWFTHWPSAGLALVLGPVSGVFVLDVDGPEATPPWSRGWAASRSPPRPCPAAASPGATTCSSATPTC
jgi:hypothetical protein